MKKLLFIYILFITLLYGKSTDFSLILQQPFDAALLDITEDYDRTISAIGFSKGYKEDSQQGNTYTNAFDYLSNVSNSYGTKMHIVKVDAQANIILSKALQLSKLSKAVSIHKTPQNGYIIGGYTLDGELIIVKLDSNANVLHSKTFGTKNYDSMSKLLYLRDGGVLAIGSSATSRSHNDALFEQGLGQNDIFITRFSRHGQKLWSQKHGTHNDDRGVDVVEAEDGSFVVVATTSYGKYKEITLMRLDENGNKIWLKHLQSEHLALPKKIISLKDHNFLVSVIQYNDAQKEHIRLIKFDLHENILLDKQIYTMYPSALNDIEEFSDQTIAGVGYVRDARNSDGLVMLLSSKLDMLSQEHYGKGNYDTFNALKILHNSQIAVAGLYTDENSQESNMWITKLNRDASMAQVSQNSSNFYAQLVILFKDEIEKKQLRIREDLTIEILNNNLYFATGEYKLTLAQKSFLEKFSHKLLPFLLQNKEAIKQFEISGHTSSEWQTTDFTKKYLNNAKLSMERSFATVSFIFSLQTQEMQKWLSSVIRGSGLSYSKKIMFNEVEDKEKSKRVTFKVILQ